MESCDYPVQQDIDTNLVEPIVTELVTSNFEKSGKKIFLYLNNVKEEKDTSDALLDLVGALEPYLKNRENMATFISSLSDMTSVMFNYQCRLQKICEVESCVIVRLFDIFRPELVDLNPYLYGLNIISFINLINVNETSVNKEYIKIILKDKLSRLNKALDEDLDYNIANLDLIVDTLLPVDKSFED